MTTVFLSRSAWGALPPNRPSPERTTTTHVFVHHSATPRPADIEAAKAQVRAIQVDHLARTVTLQDGTVIKWADIAYSMLVGPGCVLEGRGWDVRSGGTGPGTRVQHPSGSWDNISISICVLGNYQTDVLDDATREALVCAFREARRLFPDSVLDVMGDRDVNYTACCGDHLYSELPALWAESEAVPEPEPNPPLPELTDMILLRVTDDPTYPAGVFLELSGNGIAWVRSGNLPSIYAQGGVKTVDCTKSIVDDILLTKPGVGPSPSIVGSVVQW